MTHKQFDSYKQVKEKYSDVICLFSVGSQYKVYGKDAVDVVDVVNYNIDTDKLQMFYEYIRPENNDDIETTGFNIGYLEKYLPYIISAGYKVLMCGELEY